MHPASSHIMFVKLLLRWTWGTNVITSAAIVKVVVQLFRSLVKYLMISFIVFIKCFALYKFGDKHFSLSLWSMAKLLCLHQLPQVHHLYEWKWLYYPYKLSVAIDTKTFILLRSQNRELIAMLYVCSFLCLVDICTLDLSAWSNITRLLVKQSCGNHINARP